MGYRLKPFTMSVRNNSTQEFVDVGLLGSDVDADIADLRSDLNAESSARQSAISAEANARNEAILAEANARAVAINEEATARANQIAALQGAVSSPLVAATTSAMTDHTKIYVYTGSESGKTAGHWYYWNGSAWTDGGVYNATAVNTDTTLSVSGMPADALAAGDGIQDVKAYTDLHHGGFSLTSAYIESGGWVYSNKSVNVRRLRSQSLYYFKKGTVICCTANTNPITVILMNTNPSSSWNIENVSANSTKKITLSSNRWVGFVFEKPDNSSMSVSDYDSDIGIYENYGQVPGKNVWVYQYGADGNDWCFVRTPSGYDPNRKKPYSFVICNHGNGWVMDGTEQYANYTKRTMYVPTNDPDYIADPDQYNGTSDSSLWYSNPTIEALLNYGYIVCGAENYGDALYGNEQCRSACVGFYEHMIRTYNVPTFCHMIGVSNGALTALNAAYLLGGRVKSLILQYPLTCLVNQYIYHPDHRSGIRAAYNITNSSITPEELAEVVITHDPLTTDVVSGTKVGTIPPIKMWYSQGDAAVPYQYNAVALATLLHDSGKIVETVEAQGGHGDYTHFDPQACLSWFNKYDPFMLDS